MKPDQAVTVEEMNAAEREIIKALTAERRIQTGDKLVKTKTRSQCTGNSTTAKYGSWN
jgi:hypothetical protein